MRGRYDDRQHYRLIRPAVGEAVSSAGDLIGDGVDDVMVGASGTEQGAELIVVFGPPESRR